MKNAMISHKKDIKYQDYEYKGQKLTILGIGKKAIKYQLDGGEEQFAFYDSSEGYWICCIVLTSFENEVWNEEIRAKIKAQKDCCSGNAPLFAPEDGFCWSCHQQIYTRISLERAGSDLITGCPHCSRSYVD